MRLTGGRICAMSGCTKPLRSDNQTGVCNRHKRKLNRCAKCKTRCDKRFRLCQRCSLKERAVAPRVRTPCKQEGCTKTVSNRYGYCKDHYHYAKTCQTGGCFRPISVYNRSGCCGEHRSFAWVNPLWD